MNSPSPLQAMACIASESLLSFSAIFLLASATSNRHLRSRLGDTLDEEPGILRRDLGELVGDLAQQG